MKVTEEKNLSSRKTDHIELAFQAQMDQALRDQRFYYSPFLAAHPVPWAERTEEEKEKNSLPFLGKKMKAPLWISSMTGGTREALPINQRLARAAKEFGLGMGLGSCRILLESDQYFSDFHLRPILGPDLPFFANLGIAQVEKMLERDETQRIVEMVERLQADGLIIHVNPLQEWLQPEGDRIRVPPLQTLEIFLKKFPHPYKVIVKEVGQGMGPQDLKALFQLPLAAVEFSAFGGTNFSQVEMLRGSEERRRHFSELSRIGHSAGEMVQFTRKIRMELGERVLCQEVIISGGIKSFLDGHYLMNKLGCRCIYGHGKIFLEKARSSYEDLRSFIQNQIDGLFFAQQFLKVREEEGEGGGS